MARRVDSLMCVLSEIKNIGAAVGTEDLNGEESEDWKDGLSRMQVEKIVIYSRDLRRELNQICATIR